MNVLRIQNDLFMKVQQSNNLLKNCSLKVYKERLAYEKKEKESDEKIHEKVVNTNWFIPTEIVD